MKRSAFAIIAVLACAGAAGAQPSAGPAGSWAGTMQFTRVGGPEPFSMSLELRDGAPSSRSARATLPGPKLPRASRAVASG